MKKAYLYLILMIIILFSLNLSAQIPKRYNSADIYKKIKKLNVLGNALYIAAHPDDENTRLITYLSNAELVNTAYLSLTRGDGGQNSIGPEQSELLGVVRTQELLSARKVDGGEQFFTRVMDFGYSKSADETLNIWNKDELLEDVIWIIRKFKPDVMITRFPADQRAGHGQHETSAIIADEAFYMAADPDIFPRQLQYVGTWQPGRLFLNIGRWWNPNVKENESIISVDIGEFDPLSGLSYSELGADSRSQHRSQAFGVTWRRGTSKEHLEFLKGIELESGIFEGIDISWNRIGRKDIEKDVLMIMEQYDFRYPDKSLPALLELRRKIDQIGDEFWRDIKIQEIDEIIKACTGLYIEATSRKSYLSPQDDIEVYFELTNRTDVDISVKKIRSNDLFFDSLLNESLRNNISLNFSIKKVVNNSVSETSPFWLDKPVRNYKYEISDWKLKGMAQNPASLSFDVSIMIMGEMITYKVPVVYTWTDIMKGQQYEPLEIGPKLFVDIVNGVFIFPDEKEKTIKVKLETRNQKATGKLTLQLPEKWKSSPEYLDFNLNINETEYFQFKLFPPSESSRGQIKAIATGDENTYDRRLVNIEYDHFPKQAIYLPAVAEVVKLDIKKRGTKIGYILGAGDEVGPSLEHIGYDVTYIDGKNVKNIILEDFDALVFGIMAFNNHTFLADYNDQFLEFVKNGGNIIVQYNNIRIGTKSPILHPYPIKFSGRSARVRVSVEDAEVRFLLPDHPVLNYPNKIDITDFNDWVQERGLYFPTEWDENYSAVLSSNDPGEDPLDGGLLIARYGEGYYIYTSYAWFRQLPAGIPGAYRLFANLISVGNK